MATEMILKLSEAGMTSLHKAGLAGLYMTLKSFQKKREKIEGLSWKLEEKQIVLQWTDETPKDAFEDLIKKSFWIDKKGFIRLSGLEQSDVMKPEQLHLLYDSLLNSFLQYGKHRQKKGKINLGYEIDDKKIWIKDFEPISEFIHQDAGEKWLNNKGDFISEVEVPGWLYPGASKRHNLHSITINIEPIRLALPLLFAPIGVIYYLIRSKAKGRKSRLALLIPEIKNLRDYAEIRRVIASQGVIDLTASSASDAALRMLITLESQSTSNQVAKEMRENFMCRVITFGIVSWNEKQKTRTSTRTIISGNIEGFENYDLAHRTFKNKWQQVKEKGKVPEHFFVTTFCAREMIADNIADKKPWYHDITKFMTNRETYKQLYYEKKEMGEMVEKAIFDDETKRLFIQICHDSWRVRMGKLGTRARKERADFNSLVRKESEKMRTSLVRSKNAETVRKSVVDLWARAGLNNKLQGDGIINLLRLFDDKNWREARDLALLALISYKPTNAKEAKALDESTENANGEHSKGESQTGEEQSL